MSKEPNNQYLTISELCERFKISRSTFYRMLQEPKSKLKTIVVRIPPASGHLRIPLDKFERWLNSKQP